MNDKEKNEPCDAVKKDEDLAEDGRIIMQVDDKLIGDDKIMPALINPAGKKKNSENDPVY